MISDFSLFFQFLLRLAVTLHPGTKGCVATSVFKPLICPFQEDQKEIFNFCVTSSISKSQAFKGPESLWSAVVNIELCNGANMRLEFEYKRQE